MGIVKKFNRGFITAFLMVTVLTSSIFTSATFAEAPLYSKEQASQNANEEIDEASDYLAYILNLINNSYYGDVELNELLKGAVAGMASKLDDYSMFIDKSQINNVVNILENVSVGLGITIVSNDNGEAFVFETIKNTPAEKAGIKAGDILVSVDNKSVTAENVDSIIQYIKSQKGKTLNVVVKRDDKKIEFAVESKEYSLPSIYSHKLNDLESVSTVVNSSDKDKVAKTRYIQISAFGEGTGKEFKELVSKLKKENVENIIIDFRFNGGGDTQSAYEICEALVPEGPFLNIKTPNGRYVVNSEDNDVPFKNIAILINEGTASASELVTSVLKDNGAIVVGSKSFGKGISQGIVDIGDIGYLKMTIEEFFPMSGKKINGVGITPDYEVKQIELIYDEQDYQKNVETALKALGYDISTNEKKADVIKSIQSKYKLDASGVVDTNTIGAINLEIKNENYSNDAVLKKAIEVLFGKG